MSVTPSAQSHELSSEHVQSVAAIVYANESYPDAIFKALVSRCRALGLSLAGVLQHQAFERADRRCDVLLEDLTSGHRTALFEDRGAGARGCRLDESALAEVTARVENCPAVLAPPVGPQRQCGASNFSPPCPPASYAAVGA